MLTSQCCNLSRPTQCRTDSLMFVQGHIYTIPTTANSDTRITFTRFHSQSQRMCEVGIVATICRICPKILICDTSNIKFLHNNLFHLITGMIAC